MKFRLLVIFCLLALAPFPLTARQLTTADVQPSDAPLRFVPDATTGFSVFLPVVARVRGASTFFYPALDVTNNSAQSTDVAFTFTSADGAIVRNGTLTNLPAHGNLHSDDIIQLLAGNGILTQAQADNAFGTMVLTFTNPAFTTGTEASAVVRIFNYLEGNGGASIGLAYRAVPMKTNGTHKLTSVISDTNSPGTVGPVVVTNLGIANLGIDDNGQPATTPATITLTFLDPRTGSQVGNVPPITLGPGQVNQMNDIFSKYSIPADATSLVATVSGPTGAGAPQIEAYVVVKDVVSNDGSFFFMQAVPGEVTLPPPANYDGSWVGSTSAGQPMEMTVAGGKITSFTLGFVFGGGGSTCTTKIKISWTVPKTITGGTFSFTFNPTGLSTAVNGSFGSATSVSGSYGQVNMSSFMCGPMTIDGFMSGGTFTAHK